MAPTETAITVACIALALVGTYATTQVTDSVAIQLAVLIGVGILLPVLVTERRAS
jgi:hypothetical protein